jgi:hypothetical protein
MLRMLRGMVIPGRGGTASPAITVVAPMTVAAWGTRP